MNKKVAEQIFVYVSQKEGGVPNVFGVESILSQYYDPVKMAEWLVAQKFSCLNVAYLEPEYMGALKHDLTDAIKAFYDEIDKETSNE